MTAKRRQSDVEIAVLSEKVESLSERLIAHMKHEEDEHKLVWTRLTSLDNKLNKLDKKFLFFSMLMLTTAGGPNVAEYLHLFI